MYIIDINLQTSIRFNPLLTSPEYTQAGGQWKCHLKLNQIIFSTFKGSKCIYCSTCTLLLQSFMFYLIFHFIFLYVGTEGTANKDNQWLGVSVVSEGPGGSVAVSIHCVP